MITHKKIRLYILAMASAACFGFSGAANGMQAVGKSYNYLKRHLIFSPDKSCIKSFVSGHCFWRGGSEDNTGKRLWDIQPFAELNESERQKLDDSIKKACLQDPTVTCQLDVGSESQPFLIDVKISSVKCDGGSIGFFIRYSN